MKKTLEAGWHAFEAWQEELGFSVASCRGDRSGVVWLALCLDLITADGSE